MSVSGEKNPVKFSLGELVRHLNDGDIGVIVSKKSDVNETFLYRILWCNNILTWYKSSELIKDKSNMTCVFHNVCIEWNR